MGKLAAILHQSINEVIFFSSLFTLVMFVVVVIPAENNRLVDHAGTSVQPDTVIFYTPGHLESIIDLYGDSGRDYYVQSRFTFDLVWPLVYLFALVSTLSLLCRNIPGILNNAHLVPFLAVAFDLMENLFVSILMHAYPRSMKVFLYLATFSSATKWLMVIISLALIAYGVMRKVFSRRLKPSQEE